MTSYYEAWIKMMQDWLKLWGMNPDSARPVRFGPTPGGGVIAAAPLTGEVNYVGGDDIDVGDIERAMGLAIGGGAQARADGVPVQPVVVSTPALAALTLQLKELTDQVAGLSAQCGALEARLAKLLPAREEDSEAEMPT